MSVLAEIKDAWGWAGIEPVEVMAVNAFGNLLVRGKDGKFWRLCPEDLYCEVVADSERAYAALLGNKTFTLDWEMSALVRAARERLGPLKEGYRYCLKVPAVLGGPYGEPNLGVAPLQALIRDSGYLAYQITDLSEDEQIRLEVSE